MIDRAWEWFSTQGFKGSISIYDPKALRLSSEPPYTRRENTPDDDSFIHEAIYEMDPDYTVVAVIRQVGAKSAEDWAKEAFQDGIIEVSFAGSADDIQNNLDNAILEGLAHRKALIVRESRAVVRFGYKLEDLL